MYSCQVEKKAFCRIEKHFFNRKKWSYEQLELLYLQF